VLGLSACSILMMWFGGEDAAGEQCGPSERPSTDPSGDPSMNPSTDPSKTPSNDPSPHSSYRKI
jgi:hypothetical protein